MLRSVTIASVVLSLVGCVHSNQLRDPRSPAPDAPGDHPLYRYNELQYLSCDFESGVQDSINPPIRVDSTASSVLNLTQAHLDAASRAWPYALMSSNVYRDPENSPAYRIPGWEFVSRSESRSGLALEEWQRKNEDGRVEEVAVVFKGTDFTSVADWRTNLALIEPRQHREAYQYVRGVLDRWRGKGVRVVATGHSLGGALALNMSLRFPNVHFIGFDPSPRAFHGVGRYGPADRLLIYERGEILSFLRWPWAHRLNDFERYRFDFMDFILGRSITSAQEHSMYLISRGLLLAAIRNRDPGAGRAFTANFSRMNLDTIFGPDNAHPERSQHDIDYCRRIFREYPVGDTL
jgi:pimeloyl-ACP methyl ester carboxylesterase